MRPRCVSSMSGSYLRMGWCLKTLSQLQLVSPFLSREIRRTSSPSVKITISSPSWYQLLPCVTKSPSDYEDKRERRDTARQTCYHRWFSNVLPIASRLWKCSVVGLPITYSLFIYLPNKSLSTCVIIILFSSRYRISPNAWNSFITSLRTFIHFYILLNLSRNLFYLLQCLML